MLTCVSGVGAEIEQLVVAPARPHTDIGASANGADVTSLDPWAHFCVAADGGREITGAYAAIARQLRYVNFFANLDFCNVRRLSSPIKLHLGR
jgi:hypothetical protein